MEKTAQWIIETERRLYTMLTFREKNITGAAEIAKKTNRTIQNICDALVELEKEGLAECVGEHKHSWRKYKLTVKGKQILAIVERELHIGMATALSRELEYKFVKDAYRLVVRYPISVTTDARMHDLVERILQEPRTRTVYVIDKKGRFLGYITLLKILAATQANLDINKDGAFSFTNNSNDILKDGIKPLIQKPIMVTLTDKLTSALRKMTENELEDIAVVDEKKRLIGELNGMEILSLARNVYSRNPVTSK